MLQFAVRLFRLIGQCDVVTLHVPTLKLPHYGLLTLLALTIVASLKAVGIILVVAMLIAPGAIGYLVTDRFDRMLAVAVAAAVTSCVVGTLVSFHIDGATGPTIVLTQAALFLLAFMFGPKRRGAVSAAAE